MIVYKTTNLINGKIYIGRDMYNNPNYIGSGLLIKRAIKKYGKKNFKKKILEFCKNERELNKREKYWIDMYRSYVKKIGYNIAPGGQGGYLCKHEPQKLRGKNYYLNKMNKQKRENHLNKFRRGINYWKSRGFSTEDEIKKWIKENECGKNHSHKKNKTDKEYKEWLKKTKCGNNFWLNKLTKKEREKYIEKNYIGKNNPIFRNKNKSEIEKWLNTYRRGENAPNAKYVYEIIRPNRKKLITNCLKTTCKENKWNLHVLLKIMELAEGKRKRYIPRIKKYCGWMITKKIRRMTARISGCK